MGIKSNCEVCVNGLKNISEIRTDESELVNLKSKGFLTHPNENLFNILQVLETWFSNYASSPDVSKITYENTMNIS